MNLTKLITEIGDEAFSKQIGVSKRTAMSWRLKERFPKRVTAMKIVQELGEKITLEEIFAQDED